MIIRQRQRVSCNSPIMFHTRYSHNFVHLSSACCLMRCLLYNKHIQIVIIVVITIMKRVLELHCALFMRQTSQMRFTVRFRWLGRRDWLLVSVWLARKLHLWLSCTVKEEIKMTKRTIIVTNRTRMNCQKQRTKPLRLQSYHHVHHHPHHLRLC